MPVFNLLMLVFALVFFVLATVAVPSPPRFNWTPAGWVCLVLAVLFGGGRLPF